MKIFKLPAFVALLLIPAGFLKAQETYYYTAVQKEIALGKELFRTAKYNAAYRQFEKIRDQADEKSEITSEAAYYMALSALRSGHVTGDKLLTNFLKDYSDSPYSNYAKYYLGEYQYEKRRYQQAVRTLGEVERERLVSGDRIKCGYMTGYSYMMTGENDLALNEFVMVKDQNHILARPSLYYWAHINYLNNDFENALEGFRKLEKDPDFNKVIPMYVSQIYYKQEKYDEVVNYMVPIINDMEESYKPELAKIVGDSYFHLRKFSEAIQFLEYFHETPGTKSREDHYILGYSYFHTGDYPKAVPHLEKASKGNDQIAQNSYYHLADALVRTDQKEKARIAFEAASEMEFDEKIKEDALFNYAKLTYELSYSPFNETIKAFDKYITLYPNSERNTAAYQYLVDVFMITKNYKDAISSIEKIKGRNAEINQAYQRVTFYRGLELFNSQDYELALENFNKSLENSYSNPVTARTRFWRAEALYRTGDFNSAIAGFNQFLKSPGATAVPEYPEAFYSLGYACFKLEDYSQAGANFRKYLDSSRGKRTQKMADALNRNGDSYFISRNYTEAVRNYQQALSMKLYDADYSLYQLAICSGLQQHQELKVGQLRNLITTYPQSNYLDDALYELGRTYERDGNYAAAKQEYNTITEKFRESTYYPKALLQLGLAHFNTSDYRDALKYYKQVTENFSGTQEAQAALLGIKNCYMELNETEEYFRYANSLGTGTMVTASEQDSLTYLAAEKLFMANDPKAIQQLQRYLQQFPNGSFLLNANFYLGESLYNQGKYSESLDYYLYVSRQPVNIFTEPALAKASELLYNAKRYEEALDLYDRMESVSNNQWNKVKAIAGKMRCDFAIEKYRIAIEDADRLMKTEKTSETLLREASYIKAKSNYNLGNFDQALSGMQMAAVDTKTAQGAESKYLVADIHYRKNNLDAAEKEVLDFIDKGTSHQYWLAKSFILLSDVYIAKKDDFQAKHTLSSLLENYPEKSDGIIDEASRKLAEITAREKAEQDAVRSNPMEIKINQQ